MKTDSELVLAFKNGSDDAFGEIMARYRQPLHNFLGGTFEASDLVQETFSKAYNNIHSFNERTSSSFKCWLYKIARNCQIDACRKNNRHQIALDSFSILGKTNVRPPFAALVQNEYKEQVRKCIDDLSEMQREVLIMSYYHDLKYNQIAEILGCSLSAVKTHMSRAVMRLAQTLPTPDKGDL